MCYTFSINALTHLVLPQKRKTRLVYNQNVAIFSDFWQRRAQMYLVYFKREFAEKRENINILAGSNAITYG